MEAIRIIQDEHRSLAAVLHGMLYLVHQIRDRGTKPDFDLFGAMIYYIDAFPERFHHPKEDQYLFRLLRIRHRDAAPLLDRLKTEHRVGAEKIRTLEQALARYEQGGASEFTKFLTAVEAYAAFHWDHMRAEEKDKPENEDRESHGGAPGYGTRSRGDAGISRKDSGGCWLDVAERGRTYEAKKPS